MEGKTIDVEVEESVDQLELIVEASELADINNTKVDTYREDGTMACLLH